MYTFGPSYGVSRTTLRSDLLVLLEELLIEPRTVNWKIFLPRTCMLKRAGEEFLNETQKLKLTSDANTEDRQVFHISQVRHLPWPKQRI
jgi:hypothetical protein